MKNPFSVIARYFNFKSPLTYIGCLGTLFIFGIDLVMLILIGSCVANRNSELREKYESIKYSTTSSLPDEIKINDIYYLKKSFATEYMIEDSQGQTLILVHQNLSVYRAALGDSKKYVFASVDGKVIKKGRGRFDLWSNAEYYTYYSPDILIELNSRLYNLDGSRSGKTIKVTYGYNDDTSDYSKYAISYSKTDNKNRIYLSDSNKIAYKDIPFFEKYEWVSDEILFIYTEDYSGYIHLRDDEPQFTKLDINVESFRKIKNNLIHVKTDKKDYVINFSDNSPVFYPSNNSIVFEYISDCGNDVYLINNDRTYQFLVIDNKQVEVCDIDNLDNDTSLTAYDRIIIAGHYEEGNDNYIRTVYTLEEY